jgi:hypothetical protein
LHALIERFQRDPQVHQQLNVRDDAKVERPFEDLARLADPAQLAQHARACVCDGARRRRQSRRMFERAEG